jgi:hypothetical protein
MKRILIAAGVVAALAGVPSTQAAAPQASLCDRLAAVARQVRPAAWARPWEALAPALRTNSYDRKPTPFEADLAKSPVVREALGVDDGDETVQIDRLAGTDLYSPFTVQGTLHCQNMVFVRARPGRTPQIIGDPPALPDGICWTQDARFGEAFGRPVSGAVSQTDDDDEILLMPWTGDRWGAACRLMLRFRNHYDITASHCGDPAVCKAAGEVALDIARAYGAKRKADRDDSPFTWGPKPPADVSAALNALKPKLPETTEFPTFRDEESPRDSDFSYSGFALFPIRLADRWRVAAIGHAGVGWREGPDTLLAIYDIKDGKLAPLAGFVMPRSIAGLVQANAAPATAKPAPKH